MREKSLVSSLVLALLVVACADQTTTPPVVVTENPFIPTPTRASPGMYPNPAAGAPTTNPYLFDSSTPNPSFSTYPGPVTPATSSSAIPSSGFEPQASDASLKRDQVFLDLPNSLLLVTPGVPVDVKAFLSGNMPGPCHSLRVVVTPPDDNNVINLDVYTVVDTQTVCASVDESFSATIPLGSFTSGEYTVTVNGEELGRFTSPDSPQPGDAKLKRGEVSLDLSLSKLVVIGTQSGEEAADLQGIQPDPCHQLRIILTPADAQNKINLEVYNVYDPQASCIMVIAPFRVIIPLGIYPSGDYSVYVNGQLLGEFNK